LKKQAREFQVELVDWKEIHELPDAWSSAQLAELLNVLEIEGVAESEALEMALMGLQDLEVEDAADRVLQVEFAERMRAGVRQNLAHDLGEERAWEESPDLAHQSGIFNAVVLLQQAFPKEFDRPDASSIRVRIATQSEQARGWLDAPTPDPALLLRILAGGMEDRAILRRLFQESLAGTQFPEAGLILWRVSRVDGDFEIISSHQWLKSLEDAESWSVEAWPDLVEEEED